MNQPVATRTLLSSYPTSVLAGSESLRSRSSLRWMPWMGAVVVLAAWLGLRVAQAEVVSRSKDIVILEPRDLPEAASIVGESMHLRDVGNGGKYLYIEQQHLSRMIVLDVTDPSQIRIVGSVKFTASAPFDFVRDLGNSAMLVRFRDSTGAAILDLRHPRQPRLTMSSRQLAASDIRPLGDTTMLATTEEASQIEPQIHDYQVLDTSDPSRPLSLAKVADVRDIATDSVTGATYLLGSAGLTVIRRPGMEEKQRENNWPTEPN